MFLTFQDRQSDQSCVERVWRSRSDRAGTFLSIAESILDAAFEAGDFDQAHLRRSLKHLVGLTPARIAPGEAQLSLLYKTTLLPPVYAPAATTTPSLTVREV